MPANYAKFAPPTDTALQPPHQPRIASSVLKEAPIDLEPLLSLSQVCAITTYSRASIYRKIEEGTFPIPIKLGVGSDPRRGRIAWRASDLSAWLAQLPNAA